ncbi:MAG: FecR domain-containing protein [Verrucomicrobia bacterium]|nr:FecR domain-containing protein [Verrucomicrobiota bacterium]
MTPPDPSHPPDRAADQAAAAWVARRDRGLSAREQDEYLDWLRADPRRGAAIARHEETLRRMQRLAQWQPALSQETNPDLFAPPRRRRQWLTVSLAAAAAVGALLLYLPRPARPPANATPGSYLRVNERERLADGSVAELREGSRLDVHFSATERRVRLTGGEAQFTVAKDAVRPFIVEAGGVAVRALGTVFNVRLDAASVDVLVTEGRVQVAAPPPPPGSAPVAAPLVVAASQRTVVPIAPTPAAPEVVPVTPEQVREVLAWQAPRLQFFETPLADAVAEFNRHNRHRLILGDPELGRIPIGGTFRIDNVEGFARLLELTLGIRSEARSPDETVLLRGR